MSDKLMKKVKAESGNVLIVTLLILFAIAIIGSTVAMVSTMDLKISGNQRKTSEALFVAEAGLNEAIHRISLPNPTNATVGGWTGNIAISDSEPYDPNSGLSRQSGVDPGGRWLDTRDRHDTGSHKSLPRVQHADRDRGGPLCPAQVD